MQIYDNKEVHQYHQVDSCRYCVIVMTLLRILNQTLLLILKITKDYNCIYKQQGVEICLIESCRRY